MYIYSLLLCAQIALEIERGESQAHRVQHSEQLVCARFT
jgi:hypothetical protein